MGNICVQDSAISEVLHSEQVKESAVFSEPQLDRIISGPTREIKISDDISVGQWCYNSLYSMPATFELMVEADTGRSITARETLAKAVGLATSFAEIGLKKFDKVFIAGENGIEVSIVSIAAYLAGMVNCPIDASLKSYEYQHLLKIIDPQIIVCDIKIMPEIKNAMKRLALDVPIYAVEATESENVARLESLYKDMPVEDFTPAPCDNQKEDPSMIICSSGTTGLPKGVQLSQFAAVYQCGGNDNVWPPGSALLHTSYFYWISGVIALLGSTVNGIKRVLLKTNEPLEALKAIDKYRTTVTIMSPSLLNALVFHPQLGDYDLSSMKAFLAGGSPLLKTTLDRCKEVLPTSFVIQGYGATELGGPISYTSPGIDQLSLGKLNPNMKAKVVDRDTGEVLGANEEGELQCCGPSMMTCYVGNEAATRDALDEDGWYHTGDVGMYTDEGVMYITGRVKELMKVENHQIAPAEIEAVIAAVSGVEDVVVIGISMEENTLPMALVVKKEGASVEKEDIIEAVENNLSEFKQLRAGVYFVDAIPRTHTGKLKRALAQKLGEELYNGSHTE